jgi:hypothetical protein
MKTIYQKIKRLAAPVVEAYETDLTEHDRAACFNLVPGAVALWSPRQHGTHFLRVSQPVEAIEAQTVRTAASTLEYFDAVATVFGDRQWYVLECVARPRRGHVFPVDTMAARALLVDHLAAVTRAAINHPMAMG